MVGADVAILVVSRDRSYRGRGEGWICNEGILRIRF